MSSEKGQKSAEAPGCLKRRARRTSGVTSRMVSSDAITRMEADTWPSDNFLWTRDRRDCVGCSVTLGAAEEGWYSIPITQRPSDQGRLRAEHELEAASSIRSLPPSSIAPSPKGFVHKIR